ncbi:MAG: hypothetical protein KJ798_04550 [Gammaproteobacteria bacterium]|nr:hypothetical protein [Gammaproteobacteria bacterium]MBU0849344.1 hypothetical protein [Gammaproteobacteria bacterium]MBU1269014.1 hypothetical protein [Gammaproteobacteria bacterium]MBU1779636.1 hypothetical protein [Gammaproteobacteria bacterium]MBU2088536.1 hypothetical protein [Gammaproteobacteria bacterium]
MRFGKHTKDPNPMHPVENFITRVMRIFLTLVSWPKVSSTAIPNDRIALQSTISSDELEKRLLNRGWSEVEIQRALSLRDSFFNQGFVDIGRPVALFNLSTLQGPFPDLPQELLNTAGEPAETIQRLLVDLEELPFVSLSYEQERQFKNGQPVLIRFGIEPHREKRSSGGQVKDLGEKQINVGLATTVYIVVERLRYLMYFRDQRKFTSVNDHRDVAFGLLAEMWPRADNLRLTREKRINHLETLWNKGRRPQVWSQLYPVKNINKKIESWATSFENVSKERLIQEIAFQQRLVLGLLHCEIRAEVFRKTISKISDKVSKSSEESKGDRAILAGVHPEHHCLHADVLPAAFAGDINPSNLFQNLESYREFFDTMRLIGRANRGCQPVFETEHFPIIKFAIKNLEKWLYAQWPEDIPAARETAFWAKAMLSVMPLEKWKTFCQQAHDMEKNGVEEAVFTVVRS